MESIRKDYRNWLEKQLDLSSNSKKSYYSVLYKIDFSDPEEFNKSLRIKKSKSSDKTFNLIITSLLIFRKFIVEQNHEIKNWFLPEVDKLKRLKHVVSQPYSPYSEEEIEKILSSAKGWRHQVIWIALSTGLRKAEIEALNVEDIDMENGILRVVRGKGNKSRNVVISDTSQFLIWQGKRDAIGIEGPHWIFNNWGKRAILSSGGIFSNLSEETGIKIQLHRCRSTYATLLYERTLDVKLIQFQLGHSSSDITDRYIQTSLNSIKRKMDKVGRLF